MDQRVDRSSLQRVTSRERLALKPVSVPGCVRTRGEIFSTHSKPLVGLRNMLKDGENTQSAMPRQAVGFLRHQGPTPDFCHTQRTHLCSFYRASQEQTWDVMSFGTILISKDSTDASLIFGAGEEWHPGIFSSVLEYWNHTVK